MQFLNKSRNEKGKKNPPKKKGKKGRGIDKVTDSPYTDS